MRGTVCSQQQYFQLFYAHALNTLYRMNYVLMNDPAQCVNQPQFQPVMVDTQLAQLVVTATGSNYFFLPIENILSNTVLFVYLGLTIGIESS